MNCGSRNTKGNLYDGMRAMNDQTLLEHSERMAKQEERMHAHQAKYESALDRLRADIADQNAYMAKRDAQRDADAAKRDAETAKRDAQRDAETAKRDAETAKREAQRDANAAKRETDAAKRDKDNTRWQIGMWVTAVLILGAWIRWPF